MKIPPQILWKLVMNVWCFFGVKASRTIVNFARFVWRMGWATTKGCTQNFYVLFQGCTLDAIWLATASKPLENDNLSINVRRHFE